jgi:hypothetical protein
VLLGWPVLNESQKFLLFVEPHIECFLLEPLREFNLGHWIGKSLQNCGDAHHFLNLS